MFPFKSNNVNDQRHLWYIKSIQNPVSWDLFYLEEGDKSNEVFFSDWVEEGREQSKKSQLPITH